MEAFHIQIDAGRTTLRQIARLSKALENVESDPALWLDAVQAAHLVILAAANGSLFGASGTGAFDDKLAARHREHDWETGDPEPPERTLGFWQAIERLQEPGRLEYSEPVAFSKGELESLKLLNFLRETNDHPKPTSWTITNVDCWHAVQHTAAILARIPGPHRDRRDYERLYKRLQRAQCRIDEAQ